MFKYASNASILAEETPSSFTGMIELRAGLFNSFRKLDILQQLLDDPEITEVMINGPGRIFLERKGTMELWDQEFDSQEQLEDMIQQMVSRVNRTVNVACPIADARLADGSRVHVVLNDARIRSPMVMAPSP